MTPQDIENEIERYEAGVRLDTLKVGESFIDGEDRHTVAHFLANGRVICVNLKTGSVETFNDGRIVKKTLSRLAHSAHFSSLVTTQDIPDGVPFKATNGKSMVFFGRVAYQLHVDLTCGLPAEAKVLRLTKDLG